MTDLLLDACHGFASADRPAAVYRNGAGYQLGQFALSDVVRCGRSIRQMSRGAESMEEVAQRIVRHLFDSCTAGGDSEVALVRFFKTHSYGELDEALRHEARTLISAAELEDRTKCLVLLATAGSQPQWNSRDDSAGHKAIPLVSEEAVGRIPMISQLIRQFGLDLSSVICPAPELLIALDEKTCNVFHVEDARESPYIPAKQEFVRPYGIRSVLGFGGMLPTGNLFALIIFARVPIPRRMAEAFRTVALSVKTAILAFEDGAVFADRCRQRDDCSGKLDDGAARSNVLDLLRSRAVALEELGEAYDRMVILQSGRLERAVSELESANLELRQEIENRKRAETERENLNKQLLVISRQAGMAEIATGILHNVGNVLNSINVSATLAADRLEQSKIALLSQLAELINDHTTDIAGFLTNDPRGSQIPSFLPLLASQLVKERSDVQEEIHRLVSMVEHVKTIISTQQSIARVSGIKETADLSDVIEDALRLMGTSLERHRIDVVRDFADLPKLDIDKQRMVGILFNLLKNAKDSLVEGAAPARRLILRTFLEGDQVIAEVSDNGVGIPPEHLDRIFSHGFTTKKSGHGFGLHNSANAAREMGGSLTTRSNGQGRGAIFTLRLPCESVVAHTRVGALGD